MVYHRYRDCLCCIATGFFLLDLVAIAMLFSPILRKNAENKSYICRKTIYLAWQNTSIKIKTGQISTGKNLLSMPYLVKFATCKERFQER